MRTNRRELMKATFLLLFFITSAAYGQTTNVSTSQSIEQAELGWYKVYHYKGAKEIKKLDQHVFSIAQLSICDSIANWMQASYQPKGGIGDVKRNIFPKVDPYSPYKAAWPQGYGATAYTWNINYNSQGKLERIPETETPWNVNANTVPGWPIPDLSTTTQYYFTMPTFDDISVGGEELKRDHDLSSVPALKSYITFWLQNIEGGGGTENVLLCKDNKSPFIKITKREYLAAIESGIERAYQNEKKSIHEKNSGNQKSIDYFMKYLEEKQAKRLACLKNNQEKYKNRLDELAETFTSQPDVMLENFPDVFEGNDSRSSRQPIYKLDPSMVELCKKDKPQWILINWYWNPLSAKEKHMHESIINNFNFDYVYNFFFNPEKVSGMGYKPVHSPFAKEVIKVGEKSEKSKMAALDQRVHFFDDFSSSPIGKQPVGWYAKATGIGAGCVVTTLDGEGGQWAQLAGTLLIPNELKKPLPKNFTLTYDVIVPENFTWGGKGLVMILSKEESEGNYEAFIRLKIRPGFSGRNGETELETKFPSAYANGTKWYAAPGFSNDKKWNKINVSLKKNGELIQLFIGKEKVAEYLKGMPEDLLFNSLTFEMGRSDSEPEKFFIGNIKISKD